MAFKWLGAPYSPVNLSGTINTATDVDVSARVPAGATGVVLRLSFRPDASGADTTVTLRKNGSTDSLGTIVFSGGGHQFVPVGVDANRIFEYSVGDNTQFQIEVVGYYTTDAVFFTNRVEKSTGTSGSYLDVDISVDTGGDTSIAAILLNLNANAVSYNCGWRKNGSTDDFYGDVANRCWNVVGVDVNEIFEIKFSDGSGRRFYLLGYITAGATFNTNAVNATPASSNTWTNYTLSGSGTRIGGYFQAIGTVANDSYGVRRDLTAYDWQAPLIDKVGFAIVQSTANIVETYKSSANVSIYEIGYITGTGNYGASLGQATVTGVSKATKKSPGSSSGAATVSGTSKATKKSPGSAAGVATVSGVGKSKFKGVGASTGSAVDTGTSKATKKSPGTASGSSTVTGTSKATKASPGSSSGGSTVSGVGRLKFSGAGQSDGVSTVAGIGASGVAGAAQAAGTSTVDGIGQAQYRAAGASAGTATDTGEGASLAAEPGTSSGQGTVTGGSKALKAGAGSAAGVATVSGVGKSLFKAAGQSAGAATDLGEAHIGRRSVAAASGQATVAGVGLSKFKGVGHATGAATIVGHGAVNGKGVGVSHGTSTAIAKPGFVGLSVGQATVTGIARWNRDVLLPEVKLNLTPGVGFLKVTTVKFTGEPVPAPHMEDAQQIEADGYVDLFQIVLSDKATKLYLKKDHDVTWQGNDYEGTGIQIDGVGQYADDEVARPKLSVFNPNGAFSALVDQGYLDGALIVRYRVLKQHIDSDTAVYRRQQWAVSRVASLRNNYIALELRDMLDRQNFLTPGRMFIPPDFPAVSLG